MKALVPAGGRGVRLRPITHTSAKQLVPVAGTPILFSVLRHVAEAGIDEVGIVVGETGDEIRAAVGDGSAFGLSVTYLDQDQPRGLAHCVSIARAFLADDPFLMYLGDNMLRDGVVSLVQEFEREPVAAQILVVRVPDPQRFGVVELDAAGAVSHVVEKPSQPRSDLALAGVYVFSPAIHEVIATLVPSARGELEVTDAIQGLIDRGEPVRAIEVTGWWKDTGQPQDLLEANRLVLSALASRIDGEVTDAVVTGAVVVEAGARIRGGALVGPSVIGAGTVCRDATIGPNAAIGADCAITECAITDSIVMDGCIVAGSTLDGSILGRDVVVRGAGRARLVIGDHGMVELP